MGQAAGLSFRAAKRSGGRGALSNASGRYELDVRARVDDGWSAADDDKRKTTVTEEAAKKIVTFNDSPFVGFDRSINPYRGCEHGCVYCFARPTHAYLGLSPGLDFESRLFAKPNAAVLLRRELSAKNYKVKTIAIGTNTDPYQPIEKRYRIIREVLEVLLEFKHPVSLLTKSDLILRDLDLISELNKLNLVRALVSITTNDRALARAMEPRAPTPQKRFEAVRALSAAGIPTGTVHGPMIPGLTDHELEGLMTKAREAGATFTAFTLLRLPQEVGPLFEEWLETIAPTRRNRVIGHLKTINGGRLYDVQRSRGSGPKGAYADLITKRFEATKRRLGFVPMPVPSAEHFNGRAMAPEQSDLFA
ncbi:MAG: PA0069 family radical SAM protein [Pseudomonadota bacterium]